ncbi:universal stress protein [Embleya sp. NBC_00896]|uniref:universal stress protein n=1 Tax=Embleya sp. NBC_00896 TaxID=2975961 RepID=UPI00386C826F|nr:universal stress protein [Embleya sp. NBC_00896]
MSSAAHSEIDLGVLAGYDGSPAADHALDWAARDAAARRVPLYIVMGVPETGLTHHPPRVEVREHAYALVDRATASVRERFVGLDVERSVRTGDGAEAVLAASERCDTIVMGSRGHGGFAGLLLGSVSLRVCAHTTCPVVVVHTTASEDATGVVVGVGGPEDAPALEFGARHARRLGGGLRAMHSWALPVTGLAPGLMLPSMVDAERSEMISQVVDSIRVFDPELPVDTVVMNGLAGRDLVDASAGSALVVVAAHRKHGPLPMRLGPTTHAVLHHAHCPVAVVPVR